MASVILFNKIIFKELEWNILFIAKSTTFTYKIIKEMFNILVIEDEQRVAELLQSGLEENGYKVSLAMDGIEGLSLFLKNKFDLVLSDIILPKMGGFALCKEIRKNDKDIPILMLTALGNTDDKLEGFDAGADDYLTKPFDFRELLARIAVLLKRKVTEQPNESAELSYADVRINPMTQTVYRSGTLIKLTPKEYNLLLYMVQNPERIITRKEITQNVWHTDFDPGTNFIDVYINYLRKKIDKNFDVKLIHTRAGVGFIFTRNHEN